MEHLGAEFGIILNNDELREAATRETQRLRRKSSGLRFRMWLARALTALALRIEPLAPRDEQDLAESLPLLDRGMRFGGPL